LLTPEPRTAAPPRQVIPYPTGLTRIVLRTPLLLQRAGLGWLLNLFHVTILTTQGRKSGLPRHTPIEYRMHGTKVYMVSGWGEQPNWVQNLKAHPKVALQTGNRSYGATAHIVDDTGEILRTLFLFRKRAPAIYDALIARITEAEEVSAHSLPDLANQLTVVRLDLEPEGPALPVLQADLRWVLPVVLTTGAALAVIGRVRRS